MMRRTGTFFNFLVVIAFFFLSSAALIAQVKTDPIAENMLIYQRSYGGWPKAIHEKKVVYEGVLTEAQKKEILSGINEEDGTFDNKATSREIRYLVKAYKETQNPAYLKAAEKGIDYILRAQYPNGGWPQYFPRKNLYRGQITFNDNAMVNLLNVLQDIVEKTNDFEVVDVRFVKQAGDAVKNGVNCILNTQIKTKGKLTAWAAQYDQNTLAPAKARAFEPASLSSAESVAIVQFLMRVPNPSTEVKEAITSAVSWFDAVKIAGYNTSDVDAPSMPKGKDRIVVKDPASTIWARFYELETFKPIFIGRDAVVRYALADIDAERRTGYAWYGTWPVKLLQKDLPKWKKVNGLN
ncbi:pectate lyase [Desertivirga brevis]|uniref:pectate lyase n=1 Tax=Desertivirga brevis TaxID=2810310 RepID=UPI001F60E2F4|nr:pectate lyase [Pedobacter sp. SYSU D00873]